MALCLVALCQDPFDLMEVRVVDVHLEFRVQSVPANNNCSAAQQLSNLITISTTTIVPESEQL